MKGRDVWYEKSDFEQILKVTRKCLPKERRTLFAERLEGYATAFLQDFAFEHRDPPHAVVKRLNNIATQARKLVRLAKLPQGASARMRLQGAANYYQSMSVRTSSPNSKGGREKHIKPCQFPTVETAIKAIESLGLYAGLAATREHRKIKTKADKKRHQGQAARRKFINDLAGLWSDMFEELPGTSVNPETRKPDGPFIRFVMACYAPLRREWATLPELNEHAVRAHYRRTAAARIKRYVKQTMAKSNSKTS